MIIIVVVVAVGSVAFSVDSAAADVAVWLLLLLFLSNTRILFGQVCVFVLFLSSNFVITIYS